MGRRKANLEVEYELERQVKDLKQEVSKLKKILREKEKKEVKQEDDVIEVKKVKKPIIDKACPKCGSKIKSSIIPIGTLELCESACGYRFVRRKGE